MVWYVTLVAIVNLGLGYGLAVYLASGRQRFATPADEIDACIDTPELSYEQVDALQSDEIAAAAVDGAKLAPATADDPIDADTDPATGLATREHVEKQLSDMTLAHADLQPMAVALVEVEQAADGTGGIDDRLLRGIAETVRELLADVQTAARYSERQFLLLLPQDDLQHATRRAEQVRQRIEATQYMADGYQVPTTVSCALAQVAANHTATLLLESLEETLEEAKRYGGNRTFMHDGTSPTPVVPPELKIATQRRAI